MQSSSPRVLTDKELVSLYFNVCPPQSASFNVDDRSDNHSSTLLVNGLNSLGVEIALNLASDKRNVLIVASSSDKLCTDELTWAHLDRLKGNRIPIVFVDWSNDSLIQLLLHEHHPAHVVYIPPKLEGDAKSSKLDAGSWAGHLHNFVILLEALRTVSPSTRLTLASVTKGIKNELDVFQPYSNQMELRQSLVSAFELSISTYHTLYNISFSVLRLAGFYGPWTHIGLNSVNELSQTCYIDDVVTAFLSSFHLRSKCMVLDLGSCKETDSEHQKYAWSKLGVSARTSSTLGMQLMKDWRQAYADRKQSNQQLVLASYFVGKGFRRAPNKYKNIQELVKSISTLGLRGTILHNGLDKEFIIRATKQYSKLTFKEMFLDNVHSTNSCCCSAIQAVADYLQNSTDVQRVVVMDLAQSVLRDPFRIMDVLGDWVYSDLDFIPFRDIASPEQVRGMVVGGRRYLVMATLNKMAKCLSEECDSLCRSSTQCVMDKNFIEKAFFGSPFSRSITSIHVA